MGYKKWMGLLTLYIKDSQKNSTIDIDTTDRYR